MGRPRKAQTAERPYQAKGPETFSSEQFENIKRTERALEESKFAWEEAKAKYGLARAEYKLTIARRNRIIAAANDDSGPDAVKDAQANCFNARQRMAKAKTVADAAKDEYRGADEAMNKALVENIPLFESKQKAAK